MNAPHSTTNRWFYLLLMPLTWAGCSLLHFRHPGDEYGMYFLSSIAGSWIFFVFQPGNVHGLMVPALVAVVGALIMAACGGLLAWLRVRKVLWIGLFVVATLFVFLQMLLAFPSIERALSKNGSWWAYVCSSVELGTYAATLLSALGTGLVRLWSRGKTASS